MIPDKKSSHDNDVRRDQSRPSRTCQETQRQLVELVYRELSTAEAAAVFEHLYCCDGCRGEWDILQLTHSALDASLATEPVRLDLARLCLHLAGEKRRVQRSWRRRFAVGVAASLFLGGLAASIGRLPGTERLATPPPETNKAASVAIAADEAAVERGAHPSDETNQRQADANSAALREWMTTAAKVSKGSYLDARDRLLAGEDLANVWPAPPLPDESGTPQSQLIDPPSSRYDELRKAWIENSLRRFPRDT